MTELPELPLGFTLRHNAGSFRTELVRDDHVYGWIIDEAVVRGGQAVLHAWLHEAFKRLGIAPIRLGPTRPVPKPEPEPWDQRKLDAYLWNSFMGRL